MLMACNDAHAPDAHAMQALTCCLFLQVVLVVRGTTSLADALTDLSGHLGPFGGGATAGDAGKATDSSSDSSSSSGSSGDSNDNSSGGDSGGGKGSEEEPPNMAHHGILKAAQSLLAEQSDELARLLQENRGFRLKVLSAPCFVSLAVI